uniref:Copia protein n=1 Tax=Cajanus cajan TaxID=3821 RepID=A0A151R132_CAJCA|nr:Copia protein [Cajanus cajan]
MTGERSMFLDLKSKKGGQVTFGGGQKGHIMGIGKIGINSSISIDNVLYVKGLTHNLLSISQLCDSGYEVSFNKNKCTVSQLDSSILFTVNRCNNLYKIMVNELENQNVDCLVSYENQWIWHKKLGHVSQILISKLKKHNLVRGLPNLVHQTNNVCEACQNGKQIKSSFQSKNHVSTSRPLELLHIDLFGPTRTIFVSGKRYGLVIVDD